VSPISASVVALEEMVSAKSLSRRDYYIIKRCPFVFSITKALFDAELL
jgi:hypothetical protein